MFPFMSGSENGREASSIPVSRNTYQSSPSPRTWAQTVSSPSGHGLPRATRGLSRVSASSSQLSSHSTALGRSRGLFGSPVNIPSVSQSRVPLPVSLPFEKSRRVNYGYPQSGYQGPVPPPCLFSETLPSPALLPPKADQASSSSSPSINNASSPPTISETTPSASWLGSNTPSEDSSSNPSCVQASPSHAPPSGPAVDGSVSAFDPVPDRVVPGFYQQ